MTTISNGAQVLLTGAGAAGGVKMFGIPSFDIAFIIPQNVDIAFFGRPTFVPTPNAPLITENFTMSLTGSVPGLTIPSPAVGQIFNVGAFTSATFNVTGVPTTPGVYPMTLTITTPNNSGTPTIYNQPFTITITAPCVSGDTLITMADHSLKEIRYLKRGDQVSGGQTIAKLKIIPLTPDAKLSIVHIPRNTFGNILPTRDLWITSPHPIIMDGVRRPACCLERFPGVTWHMSTKSASEILPKEPDGSYKLYDLVFDHDEYYIANGIKVEAHSPYHPDDPLPKDLYFDLRNYHEERSHIGLNHCLPYDDKTVINPK